MRPTETSRGARSYRSAVAVRQPGETPMTPEPATQETGRAEPITDTPALDDPKGESALVVEHF